MFSKQNLLATLAGFVVMFLLGYAIWGAALAPFFESHSLNNIMKDPPDLGMVALANLIATFALSSIYGKWARGVHSAKEGIQYGIWVGIFTGFGIGLLWYATAELSDLTGTLVEAIVEIVFYAIIGAVIALVYKATASKA